MARQSKEGHSRRAPLVQRSIVPLVRAVREVSQAPKLRSDLQLLPDPWRRHFFERAASGAIVDEDLAASLLALALISRGILCRATETNEAAAIPWEVSSRRLPLEALDELARRPECGAIKTALDVWWHDLHWDDVADPLSPLFEQTIPMARRRRSGEFFTPDTLADAVVSRIWSPEASWLDPSTGCGAFALAVARATRRTGARSFRFRGIEQNMLAALAAAANAALAAATVAGGPVRDFRVPIACMDLIRDDTPAEWTGGADRIVGNPPWVTWDRLDSAGPGSLATWRHYGLLSESGMRTILGGGKKDLAMLVTYAAADRYLRLEGRLAFLLPESLFKSAVAGRGFRRFELPDGTPLGVERVETLGESRPFRGVGAKVAILVAKKGAVTRYPVPFPLCDRQWNRSVEQWAEPADSADPLSPWKTWARHADRSLGGVLGHCDYAPRLGVNTGGAARIFYFTRLEIRARGLWRVRNGISGRAPGSPEEIELEAAHLFPALLGRDLGRWQARPTAWCLLVQDPVLRRGIDERRLAAETPRALAYLGRWEEMLRSRAAFRRYFQRTDRSGLRRDTAPFYSMFNVGDYSMAPYKVAWNRMGHTLAAAVLEPVEGKPVLPRETHGMIAARSLEEADYLCAILNSGPVATALAAIAAVGGKSFATPGTIARLALRRFDPGSDLHQQISESGKEARRQVALGASCEGLGAQPDWIERYFAGNESQ